MLDNISSAIADISSLWNLIAGIIISVAVTFVGVKFLKRTASGGGSNRNDGVVDTGYRWEQSNSDGTGSFRHKDEPWC